MTPLAKPYRRLPAVVAVLALLLSACGGGGGSGSVDRPAVGNPTPTPPPPATAPPAPVIGSALLSWLPPTQREDGSPLTGIGGYRIEYGMAPETLDSVVTLTNPGLTSYLVDGLTEGQWFFVVRVFDTDGRISAPSDMASKVIG